MFGKIKRTGDNKREIDTKWKQLHVHDYYVSKAKEMGKNKFKRQPGATLGSFDTVFLLKNSSKSP